MFPARAEVLLRNRQLGSIVIFLQLLRRDTELPAYDQAYANRCCSSGRDPGCGSRREQDR
ncbi:hypothetical protein [Candidatus Endolissoclinum faulkneri]|uniref:hypothetical protein n=1 Tax=Candidatus Endolissoclinum faulkneri TaxID=1263979 RepID=UPI001182B6A0|nr:hypothetical protein [Candidatus Endolissoclinum faulkneri]